MSSATNLLLLLNNVPVWGQGGTPSSLLTGLAAYWKLGEASGNRLDSAGGNHLAPAGSSLPGSAAGVVGNAITLAAAQSQYLTINSTAALTMGGVDFTIAGWLKFASLGANRYIVSKWNAGGTLGNEYGISFTPNVIIGVIRNAANDANVSVSASTFGVPPTDTWLFVALEYSTATDKLSISVNTGAKNTSATCNGVFASTNPFRLGIDAGNNFKMNGALDEWGVWKRLLASTELAALYNGGAGNTYPFDVPQAPKMVAFGDSITAGNGASTDGHRWVQLVAAAKAWQFFNSGISGTVLQNTTQNLEAVVGGALTDNGRDTYAARITAYSPNYVLILYGTNDLRLDDAAFTADLFEADLGEIVQGCINAGIPAQNIVIGSPPYMNDYTYGAPNWDAGSAEKHAAYVAKCAAVATAKGTKYIDVYAYMVANGGDDLVSADGLHPNDAGHAAIAAAFLTVL